MSNRGGGSNLTPTVSAKFCFIVSEAAVGITSFAAGFLAHTAANSESGKSIFSGWFGSNEEDVQEKEKAEIQSCSGSDRTITTF